jgi:hypothetical protein
MRSSLRPPQRPDEHVSVDDGTLATGIAIVDGSFGALLKGCTVQNDEGTGVLIADNGQLEGCLIEGDRDGGMSRGTRVLVTRNIIRGNGRTGLSVGVSSTVMYNTANDNGRDGIQIECPSTVTHNKASNNEGVNFSFIGGGCFDNGTNTSPDEISCLAGNGALRQRCQLDDAKTEAKALDTIA